MASLELSHGVLGWCDGILEAELDSLVAPRAPHQWNSGLPVRYWPESRTAPLVPTHLEPGVVTRRVEEFTPKPVRGRREKQFEQGISLSLSEFQTTMHVQPIFNEIQKVTRSSREMHAR